MAPASRPRSPLIKDLRDRLTVDLFAVADEVASFGWDLERLRSLLIAMSNAMKEEVDVLAGLQGANPPSPLDRRSRPCREAAPGW